jgi:glycylpeptide N-tetradecanoyltransferase
MFKYLNKFDLAPIFTEEDFIHWFVPRAGIIDTFVVEQNGAITDMCSYYHLPSSIMQHPQHKTLKAAYSFYNVSTKTPLIDLMKDSLIMAKQVKFFKKNKIDEN